MTDQQPPKIWDLINRAFDKGDVQKIHLSVGRPPMWRLAEQGLSPIDAEAPVLTWKAIQVMLCYVVDPDLWDRIEQAGEGEVRLTGEAGRPIMLNLFRSSGVWSVVIHL